ncbi:DUF3298 domain-containing protein [Butyrivibrio sp. AE3009]|uniref:DUF3298 domain-containing protein n=1 Tax=Butyrivibrio sp. AE3009 TaxID=1280666 RepID=UPI0003B5DBC4|nr:DUF3298 domain-containing protein [Butyrivibrio sp. AE3009]
MKTKKITALIFTAAMLTVVAGCGANDEKPVAMNPISDIPMINDSQTTDSTESTEAPTGNTTEMPVENSATESQRNYSLNYNNTTLYVVDEDGNLTNEYDLEQLGKQLCDKFPGVGIEASDYTFYDNGILYFKNYHYKNNDSETSFGSLYAMDPVSGEAAEICRIDEEYIQNVDIFDGKLFFLTMPSGSSHFVEHCYEIKDGLKYEEASAGLDAYYKATEDCDICGRNSNGISDCTLRKFSELGFNLVKKDQNIYRADRDGNITPVYEAAPGVNVTFCHFNEDLAVMQLYDEDYLSLGYFVLDLATKETRPIFEGNEPQTMAFYGNYCYYYEDESICLDMFKRKVYAYDLTDGSSKFIFEETTVPGTNTTDILSPYASIFGNRFFVPVFEDNKYVWNVVDPKEANPSPKSLGYVADTFPVFDYGTVEYVSSDYKCPDCDTTLNKFYGEKFVLDSKYSDYADDINKVISDYIDGSQNADTNSLTFANSSCDDHLESPELHCETSEYHVADVCIIEDRYLAVDYSSYYYSGGAHGEPMRGQFLFDLTTGLRYHLADFYTGTEEQFKHLIADKVKDDFANAEETTYFAQTAEEAAQQAYDSAAIDDRAKFTEGGIDFMFYPYDLGPFSSGFITMHVSYEELLGRSTLDE